MSSTWTTKAVILARGLGKRMRRHDPDIVELDSNQSRMADAGLKAMIPLGRPFLDYVLSGLAEAGFLEACLVIGPEHDAIRQYYTRKCIPKKIQISYAIQEKPLGTADAVAAAKSFAAGEHFLMLNSDNYYPVSACRALREAGRAGLAAFERESLIRHGNISAERIRHFAIVSIRPDGTLERIREKPDEEALRASGPEVYVSMNCWLFSPGIFEACAQVTPSPRGELEITDAVQFAIETLGESFQVLRFRAGVLDLSSRSDIASVAERLRETEVNL